MVQKHDYMAIKVAQFSWTHLPGANPFLSVGELFNLAGAPRMLKGTVLTCLFRNGMASTSEVASFGKNIHEVYWASLQSTTRFHVPNLMTHDENKMIS